MNIIWEEKNSIELEKSCSNNNEQEQNDTIINIDHDSTLNVCKDIGQEPTRACPDCKTKIEYPTISARNDADRKNRKCRVCGNRRSKRIYKKEELSRKCQSCNSEIVYSTIYTKNNAAMINKRCKKCTLIDRNKSILMRKIVSESKMGKRNHFYGLIGDKNPANRPEVKKKLIEYQNRPEIKEQRRRTYVDMMSKKRCAGGQFYNKIACEFMDIWGKENGYVFEHAMNGKELNVAAYWVDGYDKQKNVVFEYDEPNHYYRRNQMKLKEKDLIRMKRIQEEIECDFIRYNEITKTITRYSFSK